MATQHIEFFVSNASTRLFEVRYNVVRIEPGWEEVLHRMKAKALCDKPSGGQWRYMQIVADDRQVIWMAEHFSPSNIHLLRARTNEYLEAVLNRRVPEPVIDCVALEVVEPAPMLALPPAAEREVTADDVFGEEPKPTKAKRQRKAKVASAAV